MGGIDGPRLLGRLQELRSIGGQPDGGVTRVAFSPEDVAARELVASWMREAGLDVRTDAATNLIGRSRPGPGALVTGSHLDTVPGGGWLDGAYGVVAAVEVAASLHEQGIALRHPFAVLAFANEEGAGGAVPFTGSRSIVGALTIAELDAPDDAGVPLRDRLGNAGGRPDELDSATWGPGSIAAMLELHIEQGPVLDHGGIDIGVVTAITGRASLRVRFTGTANHAGTTPMELRADPVVAAAQAVLAIQALALEGTVRTATVGQLHVHPDARNVIAAVAELGVDVRDVSPARLDQAIALIVERCAAIARATRTESDVVVDARVDGAPCDDGLVAVVRGAAAESSLSALDLPSGAGHDAQVISTLAPMAMIFVPSKAGVSHNAREHTSAEQLVAGAEVLRRAILLADRQLPLDPKEQP